jgi:hypothetical protein
VDARTSHCVIINQKGGGRRGHLPNPTEMEKLKYVEWSGRVCAIS